MEPNAVIIAVLVLFFRCGRIDTAPTSGSNSSVTGASQPYTEKELSYRTSTVSTNCTMAAMDEATSGKIKDHLTSGVNLIKFYLEYQDSESKLKIDSSSPMYKPNFWVRTPGRLGNGLLLLRHRYDVLSLMTLEVQVVTMKIKVVMHPHNCLQGLNSLDAEKVLRALVLNNFKNSSADNDVDRPNDRVCNLHATDNSGVVDFRYLCCRNDGSDYVYCKYLQRDTWLNFLFVLFTIINVLVVLFSPMFVPDGIYRLKHQPAPYFHKCLDDKKTTLNVIVTKHPNTFPSEVINNTFSFSAFNSMDTFKKFLKRLEPEKPYRLTMNQIVITVAEERLLSAGTPPVGVLKMLKESFVKCQISERDALIDCCQADALMKCPGKRKCFFVNICRNLMQLLVLLLIAVPWILRVLAYYEYEHDEILQRKEAARQRGLDFYFPENLILLLTPFHAVFIAAYIVLLIEMFLFGILGRFGTKASEQLKFVIRQCFRDMREMDKTKVVGWAVKLMLRPCADCGLIGLLIGLFLWPLLIPLIVVVLAFYFFPTVNITFRLLYHMYIYIFPCVRKLHMCQGFKKYIKSEQLDLPDKLNTDTLKFDVRILKSFANRLYQVIILLSCLLTMYSLILLIYEFVSFLVEIVVYTIMGLILNAGTLLTYVSLFTLVGVYGHTCFGNVTSAFAEYNKSLNQIVLGMASEAVEDVIYMKMETQSNVSFTVKTEKCSEVDCPVQLSKGLEGGPCWNVKRLLMFLDKSDGPFIPSRFYFKACKGDYYAAPGDVLVQYFKACLEFGVILMFLLFVLLVVMAFGDSFDISTTNRLLATVLGGFVPLLLRNFLFKSYSAPGIDKDSIPFKVFFTDLIDPYEEEWPIHDIEVEEESVTAVPDFDGKFDLMIDIGNE